MKKCAGKCATDTDPKYWFTIYWYNLDSADIDADSTLWFLSIRIALGA
jgi:predicted ATPase